MWGKMIILEIPSGSSLIQNHNDFFFNFNIYFISFNTQCIFRYYFFTDMGEGSLQQRFPSSIEYIPFNTPD